MVLNSQFKFLKNYRNVNVKTSAKREYRDENVKYFLITEMSIGNGLDYYRVTANVSLSMGRLFQNFQQISGIARPRYDSRRKKSSG